MLIFKYLKGYCFKMDDLRTIFQKTKEGDFKVSLRMLGKVQLTQDSAVKIFVFASHSCCDCIKLSKKLDDGNLYTILVTIVKYITLPDDMQLLQYMQSLFHILKYYIQQENLELLSSMESIVIPTFLYDIHLSLNEKAAFTYEQITNILLNYFINYGKKGTTEYSVQLIELHKVIIKGCIKLLNPTKMLNSAYKCVKILTILNTASSQLQKVCVYFLEMLPPSALVNSLDNTVRLVSILEHIFEYLIGAGSLLEVNSLLSTTKFYLANEKIENIWNVFEFLKIFSTVNEAETKSIGKWRYSMETFKQQDREFFGKILQKLYMPLIALMKFYVSDGVNEWMACPREFVTELVACLTWISYCFTELDAECSCQCGLQLNYYGSLKLGSLISFLSKIYVEYNRNLSCDFYQCAKRSAFSFMEYLKILKAHKCEKWINLWRELGIHIYNIGTALYAQNNIVFEDFFVCFLKYSIKYEGRSPTILDTEMCESSFNTLCRKRFSSGDYETAMAFAALYCLLYHKQRNNVFQNYWAKSKVELKQHNDRSNIQQLTLVAALGKYHTSLECITDPRLLLTRDAKVDLLSFEIERYKAIWKSRESMMAAFKQLTETADLLTVSKVFVAVYSDFDVPLHDEMDELIQKLIEKFEAHIKNNKDLFFKVSLATLYFYHYKCSSKDIIKTHVKEMERTMRIEESSNKRSIDPIPKDPNDECDIVSAYESLMINRHCKMIDILNKGLNILAHLAQEKITDMVIANTCHALLLAFALEYRLHFFSLRKTQVYELSLRFAEIVGDEIKLLYSISYLIEAGDANKKLLQELVFKGDALAKRLEQFCEKDLSNKVLITYYICKAKAYLHTDEAISYNAYIIAEQLYSGYEAQADMEYLKVELFILNFKLSQSCKRGNHEDNPMTFLLHSAMDIVVLWTQSRPMQSHELCVLFDTILELTKVYYLMKLPRELRLYSKNSALLTQKMLLPLRCASFLLFLAHSDLLTSKFDHCNVKLNGVNVIFNLEKSKSSYHIDTSCDKQNSDSQELEIDNVTNQIQELALDLPQHYKQFSPSSPNLRVEGFSLPTFMKHKDECCCFQCMCFEYHLLLLEKHHLHALLNLSQNQIELGEEFLYGGQKMYLRLKDKYKHYKLKAKTYVSVDLIFDFDDYFMECYGNILYTISSRAINEGHRAKALDVNGQLLKLLQPKKLKYVHLYFDALIQRQSFLLPLAPQFIRKVGYETADSVTDKTPVTPQTKQSTVTVSVSDYEAFSPPKRRIKKVILFESTSPDESGDGAISKAKSGKSVQRTPAQTSKLQVYTEPKTYSTRLRKKLAEKDDHLDKLCTTDNGVENYQSRKPHILAGACASTSKKKTQKSKTKVNAATSSEVVRKNLMEEWAGVKVSNGENTNSSKNDSQGSSVIAASPGNSPCKGLTALNSKSKDLTTKLKRSMKKKVASSNYDVSEDVEKLFTDVSADKPSSMKTHAAVRTSARKRLL
ncbi:uncharacterized protein LOC132702784 [Cylas formicarius]|uniref:uncharacterized protein LOC132702784 n=1 Tax=Cylas formicarius TaxID=197179 RepID=UPI002958AF2E|nr:uncharacterized protein LOC132702784 [Cylas formicarius]